MNKYTTMLWLPNCTITPLEQKYLDACSEGNVCEVDCMLRKESKKLKTRIFLTKCLKNACEGNHIGVCETLVQYLAPIIKGYSDYIWSIFKHAVKTNRLNIFKTYLQYVPMDDQLSNTCLYKACKFGNIYFINFMLNKIGGKITENILNVCLKYVCMSGNFENVNMIIKLGATDWNCGLIGASQGNNVNMVKYMRSKGAKFNDFSKACQGGNIEIINYFIHNGVLNWELGFCGACRGKNIEIIKLIMDKSPTPNRNISDGCMYDMTRKNNIEIMKFFFDQGFTISNLAYYTCYACRHGSTQLAKIMIDKCVITGISFDNYNMCMCLYYACSNNDHELVNFLIEKGDTNWNEGLLGSCIGGHVELVKLMIKYGATNINEGMNMSDLENDDVIITLINNGANNLNKLKKSTNFRLFRSWCKFKNITQYHKNVRYLKYIARHPPYVLMVGCRSSKNVKCSVKRMPDEMFVLLNRY